MTDPREEGYLGIHELRFRGKPNYDDMEEIEEVENEDNEQIQS